MKIMPTVNNAKQTAAPTDAVAVAAYLDWISAGKPAGRDNEFWIRAEERLRNGHPIDRKASSPARKATKAK